MADDHIERQKAEHLRMIHQILMQICDELRKTRIAQEKLANK
jgi:hypothetical protein